jgi:hypothetical protein
LTAQSPDSAAIITQVEAWAAGYFTGEIPDAALIKLAQARSQVARARAHQTALLDGLSVQSRHLVDRI